MTKQQKLLETPKAYSDQSVKLERINSMDNQQGNLQEIMQDFFKHMAYSIGAMTGDGSINQYAYVDNRNHKEYTGYNVQFRCSDKWCVDYVCHEINHVFYKDYKVTSYENPNGTTMYQVVSGNRSLYMFYKYFIMEKLNIPDEAFRSSRDSQLNYIAGLFDTDGYVTESNGYYRVGFGSRHRTFVEDLSRMMQKLGVKIGKIHEQISQYNTRMFIIKPNIRSFIESGCHFTIPRKVDKLAKYGIAVKPSETIMLNP